MSLVDRLLVPDAKSDFSTSATFIPRRAASSAMPQPVIPPPMTRRSNFWLLSADEIVSRDVKEKLINQLSENLESGFSFFFLTMGISVALIASYPSLTTRSL